MILPFMVLLWTKPNLRIGISDWTFPNLHVEFFFGVGFCNQLSECLCHKRARCLRLGTRAGRHKEAIHTGRGPLEENSDFGFGRLCGLSRIAETASVSRGKVLREEAP
jgi:hypothetical protein